MVRVRGEVVCDDDDLSCDRSPKTDNLRANPSNWKVGVKRQRIAYCFNELVPERRKVQSILHMAVVVIALNLAKAIIILRLVISVKGSPIMTIGDAVASYL